MKWERLERGAEQLLPRQGEGRELGWRSNSFQQSPFPGTSSALHFHFNNIPAVSVFSEHSGHSKRSWFVLKRCLYSAYHEAEDKIHVFGVWSSSEKSPAAELSQSRFPLEEGKPKPSFRQMLISQLGRCSFGISLFRTCSGRGSAQPGPWTWLKLAPKIAFNDIKRLNS